MAVSNIDRRYYEHYIGKHTEMNALYSEHKVEGAQDEVIEVVDYLYKGGKDEQESRLIEALDEVNQIRLLSSTCRGKVWRSVEAAHTVLRQKDQNGPDVDPDENEADFKAALQNFYTSELFVDEMQDTKEGQDKADLLLVTHGENSSQNDPTTEEIEFRNWLRRQAAQSHNFREILELFGAFYAAANAMKRENYSRRSTKSGVTFGNRVPDIMIPEFAKFAVPELETLFEYRFAQRQLMLHERKAVTPSKKGPIVLALDKSGSMENYVGKYKKMNVAIGFAMAVVKQLDDDGRGCQVFSFDWNQHEVFPEGASLPQKFKALMGLGEGGDTLLENALLHALDIGGRDTDVLCITDGVDRNLNVDAVRSAKRGRHIACLLVSEYKADTTAMQGAADSFILANSTDDFNHLMAEAI